MPRKDDSITKFRFRSHRVNCINSQWYFLMRDGENIGPYATKEDAKKHLTSYLNEIKSVD